MIIIGHHLKKNRKGCQQMLWNYNPVEYLSQMLAAVLLDELRHGYLATLHTLPILVTIPII